MKNTNDTRMKNILIILGLGCMVSLHAATTAEPQQPATPAVVTLAPTEAQKPKDEAVDEKTIAAEQHAKEKESKQAIFKREQELKATKDALAQGYTQHLLSALSEFQKLVEGTPDKLAERIKATDDATKKAQKGKKPVYPRKPTKSEMLAEACKHVVSQIQAMQRKLKEQWANDTASYENLEKLGLELWNLKLKFRDALKKQLPIKNDKLTLQTISYEASEAQADIAEFETHVKDKLRARMPEKATDVTQLKISLTDDSPELPYDEVALHMRLHAMQQISAKKNDEIAEAINNYDLGCAQWAIGKVSQGAARYGNSLGGNPYTIAKTFWGVVGVGYIALKALTDPLDALKKLLVRTGDRVIDGAADDVGRDLAGAVSTGLKKGVSANVKVALIEAQKFAKIPSEWDGFVGMLPGGIFIKTLKKKHTAEQEGFVENYACQQVISTFVSMVQQWGQGNINQFANTDKAWIFYGEPGSGKTASVDHILNSIYDQVGDGALIVDLSNDPTVLNENTINSVIETAKVYKRPIIINLGEALAHSGASSQKDEKAQEAYNRLLNGTEALYKESVPVVVLATHNKDQCPADLIRSQRMKVVYVGNPSWDERQTFFETCCKEQYTAGSISNRDFAYFATLTEKASRAQLGVIVHDIQHAQSQLPVNLTRELVQLFIMKTLYQPSDKQDQLPTSGTAAHRAGQFFIQLQSIDHNAVENGFCAGFANALVFNKKQAGDTIVQSETQGLVQFATHPQYKQQKNGIDLVRRLVAGPIAQKILVKQQFHNQDLIEADLKAAYLACRQIAAVYNPTAHEKALTASADKLYHDAVKEVEDQLKGELEALRIAQNHLKQGGSVTVEDALELRIQLYGTQQEKERLAKKKAAAERQQQQQQQQQKKQAPATTTPHKPTAAQVAAATRLSQTKAAAAA